MTAINARERHELATNHFFHGRVRALAMEVGRDMLNYPAADNRADEKIFKFLSTVLTGVSRFDNPDISFFRLYRFILVFLAYVDTLPDSEVGDPFDIGIASVSIPDDYIKTLIEASISIAAGVIPGDDALPPQGEDGAVRIFGDGSPTISAQFIGQMYYDVSGGDWYIAVAAGNGSSDWKKIT